MESGIQQSYFDSAIISISWKVFSILNRDFTQSQQSALQDYVEVGVMLEFNNS